MPRRRARRDIARAGWRVKDWLQQSTQTHPRSASGRQFVVRSWAAAGLPATSTSIAITSTQAQIRMKSPVALINRGCRRVRRRMLQRLVFPNRQPLPIEIEEIGMLKRFVAGVAVFIAVCSAALPLDAWAQEQQAFKNLIGRGFEIKSVTFVRGDATEGRETFVITLQRDKSVAVCYFAATSWINLSIPAIEDVRRCDVR
jgi:hypothetical protein